MGLKGQRHSKVFTDKVKHMQVIKHYYFFISENLFFQGCPYGLEWM